MEKSVEPPTEQLNEYTVEYVQRVDEKVRVQVLAGSEEEAIQKAKDGDYEGDMDTTFAEWVHDSFRHPEVTLQANWREVVSKEISALESHPWVAETIVRRHDDVTDIEILASRTVFAPGLDDSAEYRAEITAAVWDAAPVKVYEEIRRYAQDSEDVYRDQIPEEIHPVLNSHLDQLKALLKEVTGGFEIKGSAFN